MVYGTTESTLNLLCDKVSQILSVEINGLHKINLDDLIKGFAVIYKMVGDFNNN